MLVNFKVNYPVSMGPRSREGYLAGRAHAGTSAECLLDECASAHICLLVSIRLD